MSPASIPPPLRPAASGSRSRLPVLLCGLLLLWTASGYARNGSEGLPVLSGVTMLAALVLPRPLPGTARSVIWVAVLLSVLCLAANIDRVVLPQVAQERNLIGGFDAYPYDRAATVGLALGLTALWFAPSRITVTVAGVGSLPMMMMAMERAREQGGWAADPPFVWIGLGLLALAAQLERLGHPRPAGILAPGRSEWGVRILVPLGILVLSALLVPKMIAGSRMSRDWLYEKAGLRMASRTFAGRSGLLSMNSPPADFSARMRPLLEIQSPSVPGYLREATFHAYGLRQWSGRRVALSPLEPAVFREEAPRVRGRQMFALGPGDVERIREEWTVRPLQPRRLLSLCLPGGARALGLPEGSLPQHTGDGIVLVDGFLALPSFYVYKTGSARPMAFPWPDPAGSAYYLDIPERLLPAVSNWVSRCEGLLTATDVQEAVSAVVLHFHRHYRYRLGKPRTREDPLESFMDDREGHCTWFASAAALMLRSVGIPTRVVAGFLCTERHPWTGRWVVRERDAHAWCEAWDSDAGLWRLVEATPAEGLPGLHPPPARLRLLWEVLLDGTRRLTERIRNSNPLLLLAEGLALLWGHLQEALVSWRGGGVLLAGTMVLCLRFWRRRRSRRAGENASEILRKQLVRAMASIARSLVGSTLRRRPEESWPDWLERVSGHLTPEQETSLRSDLETYQSLRYHPDPDPVRARSWLSRRPRKGRRKKRER